MELVKADIVDVDAVVEIYEAVKGSEYCVWNEFYPTRRNAEEDVGCGCLYLLKDGGEILGCISVEPVSEDDDLEFWRVNDGRHREVSRVAIAPKHQGRGYARIMTELLVERLRGEGASSVHLLAAKVNLPACNTYQRLGFEFIGECHRYGADYFVCELVL